VQKWHLRYKTSDISATKWSRAKVTTQCPQKLVYGLSIGDKSGDLGWTLTYFYGGAKFFPQRISRTLFVGARRNLATLGVWTIETYSPNFVNFANFGPGYRDTMWRHVSVLHWYRKVVFDMFSKCSFLTLRRPRIRFQILCTSALHRALVPCDSTAFLLNI